MIEFRSGAHEAAEAADVRVAPDIAVEERKVRERTSFASRQRWWVARGLVLPVHLFIFAAVSFFLVRLVPGDPVLARMDLSGGFNQEDYDQVASSMGLDGSLFAQFRDFLGQLLRFDLGTSQVTGRSIWTEISTRLPSTIELVVIGLLGAVLLSLALALAWLLTSSSRIHRVLASYGRLAGAVPDFAFAILGLVLCYTILHIVPAPIGRTDPGLPPVPAVTNAPLLDALLAGNTAVFWSIVGHYLLPVTVIVLVYTPSIWKQLALGIEEQAASPATLFKIASGATRRSTYLSILRRAASSAVVMIGALFGGLVGGVVVLEQLFGFGGVGQFAITSVDNLDFLGLQGFLVTIASVCLIAYFLVDIVNMLLDPWRRPGARSDG